VLLVAGCGDAVAPQTTGLFYVPMEVRGEPIGQGFIDTGGEFEVLLSRDFGLELVGEVEILAFGGRERVALTEPFVYAAGGVRARSSGAIVGLSTCECNGVGYRFFRDTGAVLRLDFVARQATMVGSVPRGGLEVPFVPPPVTLPGFESSFIAVRVAGPEGEMDITGLLDTGATTTVLRRGVVGSGSGLNPNQLAITIAHDSLGVVAATVRLFDTEGLPDLIIGNDVMGAVANEWYFDFRQGFQFLSIFAPSPPEGPDGPGQEPTGGESERKVLSRGRPFESPSKVGSSTSSR